LLSPWNGRSQRGKIGGGIGPAPMPVGGWAGNFLRLDACARPARAIKARAAPRMLEDLGRS
jgi:hypothetical protein